ncbi:MAG: GNAT family N-acetyltransferase [Rhodoglobus sp.]
MSESESSADVRSETQKSPSFGAGGVTLHIRPATPDDAALLHQLAAATFPLACPPDALPASIEAFIAANLSMDSFRAYLSDPARVLFVGEIDGAASGYTMVVFGEPGDADAAASVTTRPTAELSKCYALPTAHGSGLAAAMVTTSVQAARDRGARSMWLGVNRQNDRANRFYEKQGFTVVGTKRFLVGQRYEDDFVRALEL